MRIVITVGRRHYHLRTPDRVICPAKVLLYNFGPVVLGTLELWYGVICPAKVLLYYFAAVVLGTLELWYGVHWQAQVLLWYKVLGNTVVLWYFATE